jgi:hypothetical protein
MLLLPGLPLWFMAFGVDLMTPVPYPIAYALLGALSADSVVRHPEALQVFPEVKLLDFDTATRDALHQTHPLHIERVWDGVTSKFIKHEGCFIDQRELKINVSLEEAFCALAHLARKQNWTIEIKEENSRLLLFDGNGRFGKRWIEWRVSRVRRVAQAYIVETIFFSPDGLPGFLYWYFIHPFHLLRFRGLIREMTRQSQIA